MNHLFLEKLLENQHLFDSLLEVDYQVMSSRISSSQIIACIESLLLSEEQPIEIPTNSLVLSTGNPFEILSFLSRVSPTTKFLLFPHYSFLGINTLFIKVFNLIYGEVCLLSKEKNLPDSSSFSSIFILGSSLTYQEMKEDFPNAIWISE